MDCLVTVLMSEIWDIILVSFNSTSKVFQGTDVDLKKVVDLTNFLQKYLESIRDRYKEVKFDSKNLCGNTLYGSIKWAKTEK